MEVEEPERRRPLGRPSSGWKNIKMGLVEMVWENVDWIHLAQDRDQGSRKKRLYNLLEIS
jgi:hypothetical protein